MVLGRIADAGCGKDSFLVGHDWKNETGNYKRGSWLLAIATRNGALRASAAHAAEPSVPKNDFTEHNSVRTTAP
jgi:hypothetical protein